MDTYEQKGYDAWVELWAHYGHSPRAGECPARYMKEGSERSAYLRGWTKAQKEHEGKL